MTNYKGDFLDLLKAHDCQIQLDLPATSASGASSPIQETEGTTVLAVRYKDGVLIGGDRRATAGNVVMYDRAEKLLQIDEHSVLAIAGSPAMAYEMARVLEHSFQYFRRSQLQELSLEGKLRMLSRLIRDNLPMTLQGIGGVIPIYAIYDLQGDDENGGKIFFYDALGAHFEECRFCDIWIRLCVDSWGFVLSENRWGDTPLADMDEQEATITVLRLLDAAAEYDSATSGYNPKSNIYPTVKTITKDGIQDLSVERLRGIYAESVETTHAR